MAHEVPTLYPKDEYNATLLENVHPKDWQNPEPADRYNLVVIGGGSAGLVAAIGAAGLGAKVALVERHLLGGDCLNVGCVPSKSVIRSSKLFGDLQMAEQLGVHIPEGVQADFGNVMARMRKIRAKISEHDSTRRLQEAGVDLFLGRGRFTNQNTVEVDGSIRLNFSKAVITTGARPMHLPIKGLAEANYLTNETLFSLTELPKRLGIIGAGPIGSELAQAFRRLGSEVILFDILPQVLGREDKDAAQIIENILRREGIELVLKANIKEVSTNKEMKFIHFEHEDEQRTVEVDEILLSAGRTPNIEGLNLEAAEIEYNKKGVVINDYLQTTNPNVYASGDVAMKYQFTHAADAASRLVLQNALFMGRKKLSDLIIPWCTYTDPEVAHVGMYPHEAESEGLEVETFNIPLADTDRAQVDGEEEGFVKIHTQKGTDKILGATIVARHAGEMINEITLAMVGNLGMKTLANVIHPYPTQAEAIKKAADAYTRTRLTPAVQKAFSGWLTASKKVEKPEKTLAIGSVAAVAVAAVAGIFIGAKLFRS